MQRAKEERPKRRGMKGREKKGLNKGADMRSDEDCLGSYTGICTENEYETPVQDADDL